MMVATLHTMLDVRLVRISHAVKAMKRTLLMPTTTLINHVDHYLI
jgi:hypothetical protein